MSTIRVNTVLSFIHYLVDESHNVQGFVMLSDNEAKVHIGTDSFCLRILDSYNNYMYIKFVDTIYRDSGNGTSDWYPLCDI